MPPSDRKQKSRLLGFESLETRKSLTTAAGALVDPSFADTNAAEVVQPIATPLSSHSTSNLLLYVATLEQVSMERSIPSQTDVVAVDQFISEASPLRFESH